MNIKGFLGGIKSNYKGNCRLKEKLIIFESDDWGAIRTPSVEALKAFESQGFGLAKSIYKYDALASQIDLEDLFDLLISIENAEGEHPIITANSIMANPDFCKIKESDFKEYHYEPFTETFKKYPQHHNNLSIWKKGMDSKIFQPQFHGREHLNINRWLKALRNNNSKVKYSFNWESTYSGEDDYSFMEALDWSKNNEIELHKQIIEEGLNIFEDTFGFKSDTFIAPCYTWDQKLEYLLAKNGIKCIQGISVQNSPTGSFDNYKHIPHLFGDKNKYGSFYNVRNVFFEPTSNRNLDWVDFAMARIQAAFLFNRPAVISSHRINYIGFIDENNKSNGLMLLKRLLEAIIKKWPDVKFISTDQLTNYINKYEQN